MNHSLRNFLMAAAIAAVLALCGAFGDAFAAQQQEKTAQPQGQKKAEQQPPPAQQKAEQQQAQKPEAKAEEEEYEIIERPTAFGVMHIKVPKRKGDSGAVAAPAAPGAAAPAAPGAAAPAPSPQQAAPTAAAPAGQQAPASSSPPPQKQAEPPQPPPVAPPQAATAPPGEKPPAAPPVEAAAQPPGSARVSLHLENANLLQVVGIIAAELKMNYIVDPGVRGVVNINTLGELRQEDLLPLLQALLRMNGATAVQSGSFWRIVQSKEAPRIPIPINQDATGAGLPTDDRVVMNVIPLRYVTAADMSKILERYLSETGQIVAHEPGNILLITDTSRSMKRLMEMVNLFDTDTLARQRIRVFPVENARATDLIKDLQQIFSAYAMSEKNTAIRFVPIERINSILVVSGNPGVFPEVEKWLEKFDQPARKSGVQMFVYKVENGTAENLSSVLSSLYGSGRSRTAGAGIGGLGGTGGAPGGGGGLGAMPSAPGAAGGTVAGGAVPGGEGASEISVAASGGTFQAPVRIVPDLINNALLIQATPQDYETIRQTLKQMDIIPRQVLIEAKVYEVTLNGALAFGVEAFLQQRSDANRTPVGQFSVGGSSRFPNPGLSFSAGTLVGHARELLAFLNAQENRSRTKVLSAPTVLASDNTQAHIQVGAEVPILTSQGVVPGAQAGGSSLFTNTVQQRDTGVILSVTPRINPSGLVTMIIQQEVSSPQAPVAGSGIQSPSIQKRSVQTQVTVQDGETISLGGIISENKLYSKNRVPLLGDIPGLGILFGSTSYSVQRTELIVLLTPRVIRDLDEMQQATQEFKSKLKELRKTLRKAGD